MSGKVVARFDEFADGSAQRFDVDGTLVAVVRIGEAVYAIGDTCSHGAVSLSEGIVLCEEKELECWKHGSTFSLLTGEPSVLPAVAPVPVFSASVVDGDIVVDVDRITPVSEGAES